MANQGENKWFEMWFGDKQSLLETMIRNMNSDLECGYDYFGNSVRSQREKIDEYKKEFDHQTLVLGLMNEKKAERWCYMDLKRRGAIE